MWNFSFFALASTRFAPLPVICVLLTIAAVGIVACVWFLREEARRDAIYRAKVHQRLREMGRVSGLTAPREDDDPK